MLTSSNNHTLNNDDASVMDMTSDTAGTTQNESEYTTEEVDALSPFEDHPLFVIPDTGWKYFSQDINEEMPTVEEQELLTNIQDLQLKLMKVREEKVRLGEDIPSEVSVTGNSSIPRESVEVSNVSVDTTANPSNVKQWGRTIVVSNRLPVVISKDPVTGRRTIKMASGGLVTALNGVRASMDFYWLGWVGEEIPVGERAALRQELMEEHACIPVFLPNEVAQPYYSGFCNNVLWPLFHYELLPSFRPGVEKKFDRNLWKAYKKANDLFADAIVNLCEADDLIWVHDFHLMLVPQMLRERNIENPIGWFLHVPFPSSDIYRILPVRSEILMGVLSADLIGFHTYDYARHFLSSCSRVLGLETSIKGVNLRTKRHFCTIGVFPIGIEPEHFDSILKRESTQQRILDLRQQFAGKKVLLGVDRIDYIKGMPHKLLAFELFLQHYPEFCGEVVMIQIGIPSRTQVREYRKLMGQVNEIIGRINGAYGTLEYTPIHYIQRGVSTEELCACYVVADVCLVTSLRDGLNLVSHEYILMQNERMKAEDDTNGQERVDPGVLLLSEFTGAIQSLSGAIRINPWNTEAVASSIMQALTMDPALRRLQQSKLYRYVTTNTSSYWGNSFLSDMSAASAKCRELRQNFSNVKPVTLKRITQSYKRSKRRLIIVNYDRVLASDTWDTQFLPPVHFRNVVVLYSGRNKETLTSWFGALPRLILGAEYGAFVKMNKSQEWVSLVHDNILHFSWQGAVLPIVQDFGDRTPGSDIEAKEHSITWFYGDADPAYGEWQAKDMLSHLEEVLGNYPVQLVKREKALEVRSISSGQKHLLRYIFENFLDLQYNANAKTNSAKGINKGYVLQERPFDFALCAVGNSTSDKELLDYIDLLKSSHKNGDNPSTDTAQTFSKGDCKTYYCQSSQSGLLFGDYVFENAADIRKLFRNLAASTSKDQNKLKSKSKLIQ
eukprot:g9172.t1